MVGKWPRRFMDVVSEDVKFGWCEDAEDRRVLHGGR